MLMHHADAQRQRIGRAANDGGPAIDGDAALIGGIAAEEDVHQRGLAGPVLAEEPEHIAGMECQVDGVDRPDRTEALADAPHGQELGGRHGFLLRFPWHSSPSPAGAGEGCVLT